MPRVDGEFQLGLLPIFESGQEKLQVANDRVTYSGDVPLGAPKAHRFPQSGAQIVWTRWREVWHVDAAGRM